MTAPILKIDFYNFGKYYFYKLKRLRACFWVQMAAALLSYPLAAITYNAESDFYVKLYAARDAYYAASGADKADALYAAYDALNNRADAMQAVFQAGIIAAVTALAVIVLMHFITPLISYRWLYKNTCADMDYSLPVSSDARFWGDFLAGLTVAVPPHIISIILGLILMPRSEDISDGISQIVPPLMWTGFLGLIMLYCLSILIMGCCGKIVHAAAMPILVNVSVPITHYLLLWLAQCFAAGSRSMYIIQYSIFVTSPLGMVLSSLEALYCANSVGRCNYFTPTNYFPVQQPCYLIPAVIVTLLFALAAWLVIRRRRAEQMGTKAFAVKPAQYIIHGLAALMIGCVAAWKIYCNAENVFFWSREEPVFSGIIDSFSIFLFIAVPAAYLILELAAGEARRFRGSLVRCAATTAAVAGITLAAMCSNGLGTSLTAPDAGNVGAVHAELCEVKTGYTVSVDLTERENIELITRLQNSIEKKYTYNSIFATADRLKNDMESYRNTIRLELEYYTYNGRKKDCSVEITEETYRQLLHELAVPEAMANKCIRFVETPAEIIGTIPWYTTFDNMVPLARRGLMYDMVQEAVRKDCENVTFERMFKCESGNYEKTVYLGVFIEDNDCSGYYLNGSAYTWFEELNVNGSGYFSNERLTVYPWFENTLALLSEYGIEVDFDIDPNEYKTAFIVKDLLSDGKNARYYKFGYDNIDIPGLFGIAENANFIAYAESENLYSVVDEETGERVSAKGDDILNMVKEQYDYLQAAEISVSQAMELFPLCGSVYDVDTDYDSELYVLVLTNITGEQLTRESVRDRTAHCTFYYIPAEHFDKAAELFNAA